VCFKELSLPLRVGENTITGGFELKTLKKLYGLRFTLPSASTVLAKQMGLGATAVDSILYSSGWGMVVGSMVLIIFWFSVISVKTGILIHFISR
jgi:hypothetical protein